MENVMKINENLPLFIFEMANNHSGDVEHGLKIIKEITKATNGFDFKFAFKFQYRDLDTFIHPDYQGRDDIKYVKRFSDTRLSEDDFLVLMDEIKKSGFITVCTPFDEKSVDKIVKHGFDIIKIASCSFTDWPLLEHIANTDKPIIASTAGASVEDMDRVVSFFQHRNKDLCLMHCVGAYPTKRENLELNQMELLKTKYSDITIGFSTHEEPENFDSIRIAIAKGARVFERHVSVLSDKYGINAYSSTPDQVQQWLSAALDSFKMCGVENRRHDISEKEKNDLRGLKRGLFVSTKISKGENIDMDRVFLAIPNIEGQILANDMAKYTMFTAEKDLLPNEPVMFKDVSIKNLRENVLSIIKQLKEVLVKSNIILPNKVELELSHHYGIEKYEQWGAAILNCINREYCKKLIILLPGQNHPVHHHVKKEETFQVLYGSMTVHLNGSTKVLKAGELVTVERGMKHNFSSEEGAVFEEISTTHFKNDSFYDDLNVMENKNRKTEMTFWADWFNSNLQ